MANTNTTQNQRPTCDCGAKFGHFHTKECAVHPINNPAPFVFPTVSGYCGTHGQRQCPLCVDAPRFEDNPEFWSQVIGE